MYGNCPIKFVLMGFLCLTCIVTTPFLFLIIRFEKNCHYRTLVNQLISSALCATLLYNLITMPLTVFVYIASPTNSPIFCTVYFVITKIEFIAILMLIDSVLIVKLIFVHFLKNPTAVQDDFWNLLINFWILGYHIINQIVMHSLPGKDQLQISFCVGNVPKKYITASFKKNWTLFVIYILSLLLIIGYFLLEKYLKYFKVTHFKKLQSRMAAYKNINMFNLFNFLEITLVIIYMVASSFATSKMTAMHPTEMDTYPNYLLIYFHDLFLTPCCIILFLFTFLYKHDNVRKVVFRELKCFITCT